MSAGREPSGLARLVELIDTWCSDHKISLSEFARQAGVDRQTLYNLRNGRNSTLRSATKEGLEALFGWESGGVDDVLANREPRLRGPEGSPSTGTPARAGDAVLSFDEALDGYQVALRRLRRATAADPDVSPEVADIIESWNTFLQALLYGGPPGVRKAVGVVAQSYERGQLGDQGETRSA
jgi:transcriptional regulator with XRE-family HTH domain